MESSPARTPTKAEVKARKAAELRGAPFLAYRDDKGKEHIIELDETTRTLAVGRRFEADIDLAAAKAAADSPRLRPCSWPTVSETPAAPTGVDTTGTP